MFIPAGGWFKYELEGALRLLSRIDFEVARTPGHCLRFAALGLAVVSECGHFEFWGQVPARALWLAFQLHDVGKMAIPWAFLSKRRRLTSAEREMVERHTEFGENILEFFREWHRAGRLKSPLGRFETTIGLRLAREIALYHHENWDGSGYPRGLRGRSIPFLARVARVVDAADALLFPRGYRGADWHPKKALEFLRQGEGKIFDPEVTRAALRLITPVAEAACPECPNPTCPLLQASLLQ
ncbi:HD domain-containing protein [Thermosulfurimonas marina]|uniref:HD domain-containing protein n=1 Tax=Thermosulfurimonas marina TaxID=2047767 RepID=A0A6H1WUR4_9BACT|nr:HD domain-containing phosphohydrolase [Thermosulfurimonas marina]QJA06846.1 HD domain-containing protein [Thermosulfurimonas marina]